MHGNTHSPIKVKGLMMFLFILQIPPQNPTVSIEASDTTLNPPTLLLLRLSMCNWNQHSTPAPFNFLCQYLHWGRPILSCPTVAKWLPLHPSSTGLPKGKEHLPPSSGVRVWCRQWVYSSLYWLFSQCRGKGLCVFISINWSCWTIV